MRNIRISDEVWEEIAKRGRFGETADDVLMRVFSINPSAGDHRSQLDSGADPSRATDRMHARVYGEGGDANLKVRFQGSGEEQHFRLPRDRSDKRTIRAALSKALQFGRKNRASRGQMFAIRKALTETGYHLTK